MKNNTVTAIVLTLILIAGLSLILYPSVSDAWNSMHQTKAVNAYVTDVKEMSDEEYAEILNDAISFNAEIRNRANVFFLSEEEKEEYSRRLKIDSSGNMGYVDIPAIEVSLPIYHGTSEAVLQKGIGHLEWTSLPVGGEGTHCVLSGHRGLPNSRLFTNLDRLTIGDIFVLRILNETLTYKVDQILIVEPQDVQALQIEEGKDLCTLVTCTPYGVNTHRLLVRGHRVENIEAEKVARLTSEGIEIEPLIVASALAAPLLVLLFLAVMLTPGGNRKKKK